MTWRSVATSTPEPPTKRETIISRQNDIGIHVLQIAMLERKKGIERRENQRALIVKFLRLPVRLLLYSMTVLYHVNN